MNISYKVRHAEVSTTTKACLMFCGAGNLVQKNKTKKISAISGDSGFTRANSLVCDSLAPDSGERA